MCAATHVDTLYICGRLVLIFDCASMTCDFAAVQSQSLRKVVQEQYLVHNILFSLGRYL